MFSLQVEQLTEEQKNGRCTFNLTPQLEVEPPGSSPAYLSKNILGSALARLAKAGHGPGILIHQHSYKAVPGVPQGHAWALLGAQPGEAVPGMSPCLQAPAAGQDPSPLLSLSRVQGCL